MKNLVKYCTDAIDSKRQSYWSTSNSPCLKRGKRVGYTFKTIASLLSVRGPIKLHINEH